MKNSEHLCVKALKTKETINIANVYENDEHELKTVKEFDKSYDYKTTAILTIPIFSQKKSHQRVFSVVACTALRR